MELLEIFKLIQSRQKMESNLVQHSPVENSRSVRFRELQHEFISKPLLQIGSEVKHQRFQHLRGEGFILGKNVVSCDWSQNEIFFCEKCEVAGLKKGIFNSFS